MNVLRTCVVMAVLAAVVAIPLALPTPVQAGCGADVYVYDLYYAAPGGQYQFFARYFVTVYSNGTDWGGFDLAKARLEADGYYTWTSWVFWRHTCNR
jgi:hypothetical protein